MSAESDNQTRLTGMVKWFNNKSGFGFITVCNPGEYFQKDIFAHYKSLKVSNPSYKYMVQGEYVEFTLTKSINSKHEYQATDITGIMGGNIMCETQRAASFASQPDDVLSDVVLRKKTNRYREDGFQKVGRRGPNKNVEPVSEENV